jgi:phosphate transport system ATP-binding protein
VIILKSHISIQNLNAFYGGHAVLRNITVDIPEKQITAIIGPSGCGKSTFLKCFNRLIDLTDGARVSGKIMLSGVDMLNGHVEVTDVRRRMGLLAQTPNLLPMSTYDNIAYGPRLHGIKDKKKLDQIVEKYLKVAGLWDETKDRLKSPASKLSIGQQQRLCLARGLAVEPEIILCDEPTSALDPVSSQHIEQQLLELKKDYTIVIVTHNIHQAMRLADYVIHLYLGELVEHGPAGDVFENPKEERTRAYISGTF